MKAKPNLIKLLSESTMIIFSILLAFGIQAWWDVRKENVEEKKLLINLQKDFKQNKELLQHSIHRYEGTMSNCQALMNYVKPGQPYNNETVPDSLLFNIVLWHTYDPVVGTLNSAITSGQISLLENEKLRAELALWADLVEDMKESEKVDFDIMTRMNEELFHYVPLRTMAFRTGNEIMQRESTAHVDYQKLLGSLYIENLLGNRIGEMSITLKEAKGVDESLDKILVLLNEELK